MTRLDGSFVCWLDRRLTTEAGASLAKANRAVYHAILKFPPHISNTAGTVLLVRFPGYRYHVHTHFWKDDSTARFAKMREATEFGSAWGEQKQRQRHHPHHRVVS